jgi:hypothetical protein
MTLYIFDYGFRESCCLFRVHLWISVSSFNVVCLYNLTTYFPFILNLKMELACTFETLVSTYIDMSQPRKL